jgi:hypothetical protein
MPGLWYQGLYTIVLINAWPVGYEITRPKERNGGKGEGRHGPEARTGAWAERRHRRVVCRAEREVESL